jgi:hypothetical protein
VIAHVRDHLSAYLDGELLAPERAAVETHLRTCPECARHLEELGAVDEAARELDVEAPPGYFDSLPTRVRARLPAPRPRTLPAWVWAAAAAVVLAALTPLAFQRTTSPAPDAAKTEETDAFRPAPTTPPAAASAPPSGAPLSDDKAASVMERSRAPERKDVKPGEKEKANATAPATGGRAREYAARRPAPPPPAPSVQKHSGPWAQSPAASQAQSQAQSAAREEAQVEAAPETKKQTEPAGKSDRDQARAGALADAPPRDAAPGFAEAPGEDRYRALLGRQADSPEAARKLHDDWNAFARGHPDSPRADEARVRAMEASALAFNLGRDPRDRDRARAAAQAYLARPDAVQAARVRALLEKLVP